MEVLTMETAAPKIAAAAAALQKIAGRFHIYIGAINNVVRSVLRTQQR